MTTHALSLHAAIPQAKQSGAKNRRIDLDMSAKKEMDLGGAGRCSGSRVSDCMFSEIISTPPKVVNQ